MQELWLYAVAGLTAGGAYALTALGVVTVFKGSGILNFAQGAIGMVGAYMFWELRNRDWPIGMAIVAGVLAGAFVGCVFYLAVIRLMTRASELAKIISTLGLLLLLQAAATIRYGPTTIFTGALFTGKPRQVWGAIVTIDTLVILAAVILGGVGLSLIFGHTRIGLRAGALHEAPAAAAALGISPHPSGLLSWGVGGGVSALAGVLLQSVTGLSPSNMTLIVVPAFAASLLGHFTSFWKAIAVGLGIGIAQSIMIQFRWDTALINALPFAVIVVALFFGGVALPGRGFQGAALPHVGPGKIKPVKIAVGLTIVGVLSSLFSPTWDDAMISSAIFGLLALSIVVVTGYAGQISLASSALGGFAALITAHAGADWDLSFLASGLIGIVAAVAVGVVVGVPAVRVRGTNLAVATLGLGLMLEDGLLKPPRFTGGTSGIRVNAPHILGVDLNPGLYPARYAWFCLAVLLLASIGVANMRRGRAGRRLVAVRANERGAASCGVSIAGTKLAAFAVSAGLAGAAGVLTTYRFQVASFQGFNIFQSVNAVVFTVLGGVGFISGAVFAGVAAAGGMASYILEKQLGLDAIDEWLPVITGLAVLDVMIRFPDGIVLQFRSALQLAERAGRRLFARARPHPSGGTEVATHPAHAEQLDGWREFCLEHRVNRDAVGMTITDASVTYGSTIAVDKVSLTLQPGRVVGLIGANGAGKTSFIDSITGYTPLSGGTITLAGREVSKSSAKQRTRLGIGRTFQNLELFEDLTVRENLLVACDRHDVAAYLTAMFTARRSELTPVAAAVASALDLERDLDTVVAALPQGRRRVVAIARLVASSPSIICLDEPAAGLSGPERRVVAALFRSLADDLGAAVLLVEHNVDVVAETCDELVVLDFGRVIAQGPAEAVLSQKVVRDAYLGAGRDRHSPERFGEHVGPTVATA